MRSSMFGSALALALTSVLCEAAVEGTGNSAGGGAATPAATAKSKTEVEKVTMEDGRVVDFAGKRKLLKEVLLVDGQLPSVRFDFRNGKTRVYQVIPQLFAQFAAHGASQKIGDETAGEDDVDDMLLAVEEIIGRLSSDTPEWTVKREGGGFGGVSILLRALMEQSGKDEATVKAFLKPKSHGEKMALRAFPTIKVIVDRLEAEKLAKAAGASKVDAGALLSTL